MKKIILSIICFLFFSTSNAQGQFDLSTGVNQDNLKMLQLQEEIRKKDLNENFNVPTYEPPKTFKVKTYKIDSKTQELPRTSTIEEDLDSKDPKVVQNALDRVKEKAQNSPGYYGVGYDNVVKYQAGQDEFNGGYYGFNPYKTVEENKKWYADMGFTMSYKYSDKQIYTWIAIGISALALIIFGIFYWKKNLKWKEL